MTAPNMREFLTPLQAAWPRIVDATITNRLTMLFGRLVNLKVVGGESYAVAFHRDRLEVELGENPRPDAVIEMSPEDWADVLAGRTGVMSVVVAGRCPYPKHHRMPIAKLSLVLQTLATMEVNKA